MRGSSGGLGTPHPLATTLPALLAQDDFVQRMCGGLDDVLAPVFATLDCFPAYLDPATTPEDMLAWLAGWIGLTLEAGEPPERCRELVLQGVAQLGRRGTTRGLAVAIETVFGVQPEILESGGAAWSARPGSAMPGAPAGQLLVRLRVRDASTIDFARLDALVAALKPAHIPHRVEVIGDPPPEPPPRSPAAVPAPRPMVRPDWAPSVAWATGTPVVSFVEHQESTPDGSPDGDAPSG